MRIYKYELNIDSPMPAFQSFENSELLDVAVQDGKVVAWVICDPDSRSNGKKFEFKFLGTGQDFSMQGIAYLKTLLLLGGSFVLHVFAVQQPSAIERKS